MPGRRAVAENVEPFCFLATPVAARALSAGPRGGVGLVDALGDPPAAFSGLVLVFETQAPGCARTAPPPPTFDPLFPHHL